MGQRQEGNHAYGGPVLHGRRLRCRGCSWRALDKVLLRNIKLLVVVAGPEPRHVVVREHYAFGITSRATCINDIAAHPGPLLLDTLEDYTVFHFASQLHDLAPIVDFEPASTSEGLAFRLFCRAFSEQKTGHYPCIGQSLIVLV